MTHDDLDFSKLTIPVDKLSDKQDPFDEFPDTFQKYAEFHLESHLQRRKVLKYIVYVYDTGTPFKGDIYKTKVKAAELAGFERDENNKFSTAVESMFLCEIESITKMIVRYVTNLKNSTYQKLIVLREAYYRASKMLLEGDGGKNSIKELTSIEEEIESTELKLLNQDKQRNVKRELFRFYLEDNIELRPEDIVRKLRENPNAMPV